MKNTIKLEVTLNQLNVVLSGLGRLPLEYSIETFNVVRQQAEGQVRNMPQERPEGPLADKVID